LIGFVLAIVETEENNVDYDQWWGSPTN